MTDDVYQSTHVGVVTKVEGDMAFVRFQRGSMCAHCGACLAVGEKQVEMRLKNVLNAAIGDEVQVSMESGRIEQAGVLAYVIPLILLIAGVALGGMISDWAGLGLGIGGCLLAFLLLRWMEKKHLFGGKFQPRMCGIVKQAQTNP